MKYIILTLTFFFASFIIAQETQNDESEDIHLFEGEVLGADEKISLMMIGDMVHFELAGHDIVFKIKNGSIIDIDGKEALAYDVEVNEEIMGTVEIKYLFMFDVSRLSKEAVQELTNNLGTDRAYIMDIVGDINLRFLLDDAM